MCPAALLICVLYGLLFIGCTSGSSYGDEDTFGRLIIQSDESLRHDVYEMLDEQTEPRATFYRTVTCDVTSECVPLSECTFIQYQAAKACYTGDRSLNCGASDVEPYVCCPRKVENVQSCGKSLVTGQFYKGLGSVPYVARIGFKSESKYWSNINTGLFKKIIKLIEQRIVNE